MIEFPETFFFFFYIHHFQRIFLPVRLHSDMVNNCEAVRYGKHYIHLVTGFSPHKASSTLSMLKVFPDLRRLWQPQAAR